MKTIRTFVAAELSPDVRSRALLLVDRLKPVAPDVRWVEPEGLHLTLNFLGEVPNDQAYAVCRTVSEATAKMPPFAFECCGAGAFPNIQKPRTIWLGVTMGGNELAQLYQHIQDGLESLHLHYDTKRFHPHVTLGRVRGGNHEELTGRLEQLADFTAGNTYLDEAIIFSSVLEKSGPIYDVMGRAPLGE